MRVIFIFFFAKAKIQCSVSQDNKRASQEKADAFVKT